MFRCLIYLMWREMVLLILGSLYVHWAYFIPMLRLKSKSIVSQFVSSASSDLHFKVVQGCILKGILTLFRKLLKLIRVYVLLFYLPILWTCHFKAFWNFFSYPAHHEKKLHSKYWHVFPLFVSCLQALWFKANWLHWTWGGMIILRS